MTVEKKKAVSHEILVRPGETGELSFSRIPFYINVPIEKAKKLKNKLQIGHVVKLKEPFFSLDGMHIEPKLDRPFDLLAIDNQIIADLICVLVTDDKNQVLKTFEPFLQRNNAIIYLCDSQTSFQ